jgi:hypothetical protein
MTVKVDPTLLGVGDTIVLHNARRESKAVKITRVHTHNTPGSERIAFDTASGRIVVAPINGDWPQVDAVLNPNSAGTR